MYIEFERRVFALIIITVSHSIPATAAFTLNGEVRVMRDSYRRRAKERRAHT